MQTFDDALRALGRSYTEEVTRHGGRSLARVATLVVNRGSFFASLERGGTCTARNVERVAAYFRTPAHWPAGVIPDAALAALEQIGRPALVAAE